MSDKQDNGMFDVSQELNASYQFTKDQLAELENLRAENARLRAALEKIAGIRGRDLSEPWSNSELAEIALKGQP